MITIPSVLGWDKNIVNTEIIEYLVILYVKHDGTFGDMISSGPKTYKCSSVSPELRSFYKKSVFKKSILCES